MPSIIMLQRVLKYAKGTLIWRVLHQYTYNHTYMHTYTLKYKHTHTHTQILYIHTNRKLSVEEADHITTQLGHAACKASESLYRTPDSTYASSGGRRTERISPQAGRQRGCMAASWDIPPCRQDDKEGVGSQGL